MTTKIKIFFVFLAVLAVVSVVSFFDVFRLARSDINSPKISSLEASESDIDNDGLLNGDETYWETDFNNPDTDGDGFLDGEEVASGHDPVIPAPNDVLIYSNLTEQVANLAVAGLAEGSLKPDSDNFEQSMSDLTLSIVDQSTQYFTNLFDPSKIRTVDNTQENKSAYLVGVAEIWILFMDTLQNENKDIELKLELTNSEEGFANQEYIEFFISFRDQFDGIATRLMSLEVPESWINEHKAFLDLTLKMSEINRFLAQAKEDPVKATIAIKTLVDTVELIPDLIATFSAKTELDILQQ